MAIPVEPGFQLGQSGIVEGTIVPGDQNEIVIAEPVDEFTVLLVNFGSAAEPGFHLLGIRIDPQAKIGHQDRPDDRRRHNQSTCQQGLIQDSTWWGWVAMVSPRQDWSPADESFKESGFRRRSRFQLGESEISFFAAESESVDLDSAGSESDPLRCLSS